MDSMQAIYMVMCGQYIGLYRMQYARQYMGNMWSNKQGNILVV
jgi:hypothetical protein